jgi:uncharacterized protein YbjT (DUF2867 family)
MASQKRVLVGGATGRLGAVVPVLLDRGHSVRALTRETGSPAADKLRDLGAEVVYGDFDQPESIEIAGRGVDAAFFTGTAHRAGPEGEARRGRNFADAAAAAGVPHVVYSSVAGADQATGLPVFESKLAVEQRIQTLGLAATVLAPVYFMENVFNPWNVPVLEAGRLPVALPPQRSLQQIPIVDVANFAALVIERPGDFVGRRIELASDELTGLEGAKRLSHVLGRHVEVAQLEQDSLGPGLRALFSWLDRVGHGVDVKGLRARYPDVGWHRFEDWAAGQDWSAIPGAETRQPSGCAA